MFHSGVDDSFIHCLKRKRKQEIIWIMLSLVLKPSVSTICFELFMYLLPSFAETCQHQESLRR